MEFGNVSVYPGWDGWIGALSQRRMGMVRTFGGDDIDVGWMWQWIPKGSRCLIFKTPRLG